MVQLWFGPLKFTVWNGLFWAFIHVQCIMCPGRPIWKAWEFWWLNWAELTILFRIKMLQNKFLHIAVLPTHPHSYKSIVEFIDAQFEAYLQEELKIKRTLHSYHDTRIHACLYFIAPTGHSLKSLDLVTMKKLDSKVSVVCATSCLCRLVVQWVRKTDCYITDTIACISCAAALNMIPPIPTPHCGI